MKGYAIVDARYKGIYWAPTFDACVIELDWQIKFGWGDFSMLIVPASEAIWK